MARFNTYSQLVSSANNSSADDDEENEEAEEVIDEDREDLDDMPTADEPTTKGGSNEDEGQDDEDFNVEHIAKAHNKKAAAVAEAPRVQLEAPKSEPLVQEYTDNNYWKGQVAMSDIDDLLADYE